MTNSNKDVLAQNVSDLIESGGEAPKIAGAARTRIREGLVAKFAVARADGTMSVTTAIRAPIWVAFSS